MTSLHRLAKLSCVLLILVLSAAKGSAETSASANDEFAIKQLAATWESAWNRRDADAMTSLLAEDVDFITVRGPEGWLKGREEFRRAHAAMFKSLFTESTWTTEACLVKFVRGDLANARVFWSTAGDKVRHIRHGDPRRGVFTWLVEKRDGKWLVIASQNTEAIPPLPGQ